MLIPDLLNFLFDQADYSTLVGLSSLQRRKTAYANKYSLLRYRRISNNVVKFICKDGNLKALKHIIGCYPEFCPKSYLDLGSISISTSIYYGNLGMVRYLLSIGWKINYDIFALDYGALHGHLDIVRYLISIGLGAMSNKALLVNARDGRTDIIKCLVEANVYHWLQGYACGALKESAKYGQLETVKYLVGFGAYCGLDADGERSLALAACNGHLNVVKHLISVGANVNAENDLALQWSAKYGQWEIVRYLISVGANIHVNNDELLQNPFVVENLGHLF